MKESWLAMVAGRYFRTRRREKKNTITILSMVGLALGVATLITSMAVMNGFQGGTIRLLLEFHSFHLRLDGDAAQSVLRSDEGRKAFLASQPLVDRISVFSETQGLVRTEYSDPRATMVRSVEPGELPWVLEHIPEISLIRGNRDFTAEDQVFVGERLANAMGLRIGSRLSFMAFDNKAGSARDYPLEVTGILDFADANRNSGFCLVNAESALGKVMAESSLVGIRLLDSEKDQEALREIGTWLDGQGLTEEQIAGDLESWRTYNASIFGALRMEKTMIMLIIGLMFVVVGVNIFHDMRVSVMEKQEDIGVLRALGASAGSIRLIFVAQGLMIGTMGALLGFLAGIGLTSNINALFGVVGELSRFFGQGTLFFPELPVELALTESIAFSLGAILVGVLAARAAAAPVSRMDAAAILRYE